MVYRSLFIAIIACVVSLPPTAALAHMPWLYISDDSYARLFFGESLAEREYHTPDAIAAAEVWQDGIDAPPKRLAMEGLEEEGFLGLEGEDRIEPRGVVRTTVVYGNYHGSLLTYDAQHFPGEDPKSWPNDATTGMGIEATLVTEGSDLLVTVTLNGEPLAAAKASLTNEEGGDGVRGQADDAGVVRFDASALIDGLNGVMVMHVDPTASGEHDGEPYTSSTRILTATFHYDAEAAATVSALPPVPEALASFGAAVSDGWLYVYGGHIGQAHDHSRDNLSKHFRRIRLDRADGWEELPMDRPLQGLPLVAHGGKLYRVGGLEARNASGEEEELHSVEDFAVFDPEKGSWAEMPPLPGPRSSHNAVLVGDTVYVVGGWALSGSSDGDWQSGALAYDLAAPDAQWRELPEPPFKRRALAVGHVDGQVVALCGMTDDADLSKQVFFYDPEDRAWTEGPEFPGNPFHGFGLSAWNLDGVLYAGGMEGILYRLTEDRTEWVKVSDFATKRFFHQLVPDGEGSLLAVAGASPEVGRTGSVERLSVEPAVVADAAESADEPEEQASHEAEADDQEPSLSWAEPDSSPPDRWPGFRGVGTSVSQATDLPVAWSDDEGIAWRTELPGYGQASPVVWGDRVFVTAVQGGEKETPTVLCFDLVSGRELWRREFESSQRVAASNYVSRSAPTPCLDGDHVYAFFESGDLFALGHAGELLWERSLVDEYGPIEGNHGIAGSPLLVGTSLIVPVLHGGPSYLLAIDATSGGTNWKADFESRVAWSSPSVAGDQVLLSGAGAVEAYNLSSGSLSWRLASFSGNNVPSPTVAGNVAVIGSQERSSNAAVSLSEGTPTVAWRGTTATSSFASPLLYGGRAYFVSKAGIAYCLDAASAELLWKERLPGSCWASPLAAAGLVYFFCKDGEAVVYESDSGERAGSGALSIDDGSRLYGAAAVERRLLLRTASELICICKAQSRLQNAQPRQLSDISRCVEPATPTSGLATLPFDRRVRLRDQSRCWGHLQKQVPL